jgi:acyl-coenzyme A synthetase/AMP-(fatty) acid ligase
LKVAGEAGLPKTISGKIRRSELRDQLRAGTYD